MHPRKVEEQTHVILTGTAGISLFVLPQANEEIVLAVIHDEVTHSPLVTSTRINTIERTGKLSID